MKYKPAQYNAPHAFATENNSKTYNALDTFHFMNTHAT